MAKACKWCKSPLHTAFYCFKKPRKEIVRVSRRSLSTSFKVKKQKAINKIGPRARQWNKTSKLWKQTNPPDSRGFWYCRVGGAALTDKKDVEALRLNICHIESRARRPDLAFNLDNLFAGCPLHNKEQGSRSLKEYLASSHSPFCADF